MSNASLARGVGAKPKKSRRSSAVNPQHEAFANALLQGASDSEAARVAGYNPGNAFRVMRQETVQQILAESRAEIEELTTLKRLDVLNMFLEAIDMARVLADPGQMINGADKIAKMMGYYAPETKRIELTTDQGVLQSKFQQMTDQELLEIAAGRARVIDGEVLQ